MISFIKLNLLLLGCSFIVCRIVRGEIILNDDKAYEVLDIRIPQTIWKQALNPTPVLKSQATIVVPIHVTQEENDADDVDDEITNDVEVTDVVNTTVSNDEIVQDTVAAPAGNDTQNPVAADDAPVPPQQVTGQLVRFPCSCIEGQCGCCTGAFLERIQMKACGNISFVPEDFVFDVRLNVNNSTVVRRRVSASDPPPVCFNPRRAPFVTVCAEISNIRIRNRNAFACLDINANVAGFPVYSAPFRCFGLGSSGVQTGLKPKPVSSGPKPVSLYGNNDEGSSFLENPAGAILGGVGGGEGGLFGEGLFGGGSDDGADDDGGPLDAIGDAVGDFFDGRNMKL